MCLYIPISYTYFPLHIPVPTILIHIRFRIAYIYIFPLQILGPTVLIHIQIRIAGVFYCDFNDFSSHYADFNECNIIHSLLQAYDFDNYY